MDIQRKGIFNLFIYRGLDVNRLGTKIAININPRK